jgi:CheY-like chemotaxis protein
VRRLRGNNSLEPPPSLCLLSVPVKLASMEHDVPVAAHVAAVACRATTRLPVSLFGDGEMRVLEAASASQEVELRATAVRCLREVAVTSRYGREWRVRALERLETVLLDETEVDVLKEGVQAYEGTDVQEVCEAGRRVADWWSAQCEQVRRRGILLSDDNADSVETLREVMELWGCVNVHTALDGPVTLELFQRVQPDLVISDIDKPGMDGYELARQIRAAPGGDRVYLVALTGYGGEEDRRKCRDAGFDLHIAKPIDIEALQYLVRFHFLEPYRRV